MIVKDDNKDTEQRILKYAEEEFLSKGFAGARTTSIAEAAGVTHAMFHYYFRTKEKLFERILREKMGKLHEMLVQSVAMNDKNAQIEDIIREIIDRHLDFLGENPKLPIFVIGEMQRNPIYAKFITENIEKFSGILLNRLQLLIDDGVRAGRLKYMKAETLLLDIISLNIFAFMARPLVNVVLGGCMDNIEEFISQRKKENFKTIMCKLKN